MRDGTRGRAEAVLPPLTIDRSLAFQHRWTFEALSYWNSCLKGRTMPSRADLEPKKMRAFLPNMALVEPRADADRPNNYFVRLAGTGLEQIYGAMSGRLIADLIPPVLAERWGSVLGAAVAATRPIRTIGRMAFERRFWLEVESLVAPLSNDEKTVSMLYVVVATWEAGLPPPLNASSANVSA